MKTIREELVDFIEPVVVLSIAAAFSIALVVSAWVSPPVHAQSTFTPPNAPVYRMFSGRLTGTPTNICGGDCFISSAIFSTNSSSGSITAADAGTGCASGACNFANGVSIAANTTYEMFKVTGAYAPGGLVISGTGTVDVHIVYTLQGGLR